MSDEKKKVVGEAASFLKNLSALLPTDEVTAKRWPTLAECLLPKYKAQVCVRQPGRMALRAEGTYWKISLECPTEGVQTHVLLETLDKLFDQVEKLLASGAAHWTPTWSRQKKARPVIDPLL